MKFQATGKTYLPIIPGKPIQSIIPTSGVCCVITRRGKRNVWIISYQKVPTSGEWRRGSARRIPHEISDRIWP